MSWVGRWFRVIYPVAAVALTGCGLAAKPYANDPLLKSGRAVRGDQETARALLKAAEPEPAAPSAPRPPDTAIIAARDQ
jgi:hypothetical protein